MGNTIPQSTTTSSNTTGNQTNSTNSYVAKTFPHVIIEHTFPPGSGRIFRSYRIRCPTTGSSTSVTASTSTKLRGGAGGTTLLVCKAMVFRHQESKSEEIYAELSRKANELEKIREILQDLPNVLPYQKWSLSTNTTLDHRLNIISQPIFIFRQNFYSTLSDRLAMRPFLTNIEKTWIAYQILRALSSLHERNVFHGNLTADNICITSWGWICIVDIDGGAGLKPVRVKDYDLSDFIYHYKKADGGNQADGKNEIGAGGDDAKNSGCYLAPERFYKRGEEEKHGKENECLTANMDVFAVGCVIIEMYLNGEKALDLGDLMEYRSKNTLVPSLKQKLNKIESSNIRAACKHMLSLDPSNRLSAKEYLNKLSSGEKCVIPPSFESFLWPFMKQFQNGYTHHQWWTHDAKVALLAKAYGKGSLRCFMEKGDLPGEKYFRDVIGPTIFNIDDKNCQQTDTPEIKEKVPDNFPHKNLLAETEAILERLESKTLHLFIPNSSTDHYKGPPPTTNTAPNEIKSSNRSSPQSIILILQFLLSSLRHVHRPSAKLLSLQLILHLNRHIDDETRLQRVLPNVISLMEETQSFIRAQSLRVLTTILECIESFPPSDAQLFPQYVMKRVQHLALATEDEVVRVAFAECLGRLAVTSKRFLDISHAMRLQDALDGGGNTLKNEMKQSTGGANITSTHQNQQSLPEFPDDVAELLGSPAATKGIEADMAAGSKPASVAYDDSAPNAVDDGISPNKILMPNMYDEEFQSIQDVITSYITQLTTTSSSHIKRALLISSLSQLASFFGEEGTITRLLPTILTFWNDLGDWEVRAALCKSLPSICHIIGRVGTEEFVLPCIEVACLDGEELVVGWALWCLNVLVEERLIRGREVLLGDMEKSDGRIGVLQKYAPLLIHPCEFIRHGSISLFCASWRAIGFPDDEVFVLPILRPFLKYEPTRHQLQSKEDLKDCLLPPISRCALLYFIQKISKDSKNNDKRSEEDFINSEAFEDGFHSINIDDNNDKISSRPVIWDVSSVKENKPNAHGILDETFVRDENEQLLSSFSAVENSSSGIIDDEEMRLKSMKSYLDMRQKRNKSSSPLSLAEKKKDLFDQPENNILLSESYSFAVPNQKYVELVSGTIPNWYEQFRSVVRTDQKRISECSSLKSLRSLKEVYGVSVLLPSNPNQPIRKWRGDFSLHENFAVEDEEKPVSHEEINSILSNRETVLFDAARKGEFGATATLEPCLHDVSLLGIKIQSLGVPPLPPQLGVLRETDGRVFSWHMPVSSSSETNTDAILRSEWKPKVDSLLVSTTENVEHTAAVSRLAVAQDQSFFVSASHDGTSRVWELKQMEDAVSLRSSLIYSGHRTAASHSVRLNDVCIVENGHSVASAANNGCVHVWRIDMSSSKGASALAGTDSQDPVGRKTTISPRYYDTSHISGNSLVRQIDPREGEILAVSHFNTPSASLVSFATPSRVHGWDLRCAMEPFSFPMRPELGYITSMAVGNDRNWMVAGTNRGYLALWDIRFQYMVKLWQHSSAAPVARLATCFTTLPQDKSKNGEDKPFIFMGCGPNEAAIFDISTGDCRQCFRVLDPALCYTDQMSLPPSCITMPTLNQIGLPSHPYRRILPIMGALPVTIQNRRPPPEPSVQSIMGRIGRRGQSYIITGGSDCFIRYWDFMSVSRCYTVSGISYNQPKPSFESVDVGPSGKLFLCRQVPISKATENESSKQPRQRHRGTSRPDGSHRDAVLDLKNVDFPVKGLLSCSRDGVIKMWR